MYYGPTLLQKAGFGNNGGENEALIAAIPLAFMNALGTLVAIFYIDKLGRRFIMLRTLPGVGLSLLVISAGLGIFNFNEPKSTNAEIGSWVALSGILLYLAFFSIGMGCTPWTVNSEIYPLYLRGCGLSISTTANWITNYFVSQLFLTLTSSG